MTTFARTTLRLDNGLKKQAERRALEDNTTLQAILNQALEEYLQKRAKNRAKRIAFRTHDLGEPLDRLTREDFYAEP